jgi:hypothetical protein
VCYKTAIQEKSKKKRPCKLDYREHPYTEKNKITDIFEKLTRGTAMLSCVKVHLSSAQSLDPLKFAESWYKPKTLAQVQASLKFAHLNANCHKYNLYNN